MNPLRRALRYFAAPANSAALILRSYSSAAATTRRRTKAVPPPPTAAAPSPDIPKPTEIPFQPKVANAVNLIGQVRMPVQFQACPEGKTYAATVITSHESHSSPFLWIPVIFEGDLAHTAACHLKENDFIYVAGQLSTDPPRLDGSEAQSNNNIQVMVQSLNFVQGYPQLENIAANSKQEKTESLFESGKLDTDLPRKDDVHSYQTEEHDINKSWKDLLSNPVEWWDVRLSKNPDGAAFERKTNGELLFIDSSTPKWLQDKLASMTTGFDLKPESKQSISSSSWLSSWTDLLDDPKQWFDYRDKKHKGLVKPKYPDFKRKDGSVALWLNQAPNWVLSKLEGLEFDIPLVKSNHAQDSKGDQWNDLVNNPNKWWDNRSNKRNVKAPDFKHKDTGDVLWLDSSPSWVLSKLPPVKPKQSEEIGSEKRLVS